jgi:hypothetical protein
MAKLSGYVFRKLQQAGQDGKSMKGTSGRCLEDSKEATGL